MKKTVESITWDIKGYKGKQKGIKKIKIKPSLEVVENQYQNKNYIVELKMEEFTCLCPKTHLPDLATIIIQYKPGKWLVEQKSLKLYLTGYRDLGIFQEHATNKIFGDFLEKVKPKWAKIITLWRVRGGIATKVGREFPPNTNQREQEDSRIFANK